MLFCISTTLKTDRNNIFGIVLHFENKFFCIDDENDKLELRNRKTLTRSFQNCQITIFTGNVL